MLLCPPDQAWAALAAMCDYPECQGACIIGHTLPGPAGRVTVPTAFGRARLGDMLVGEPLPRIC